MSPEQGTNPEALRDRIKGEWWSESLAKAFQAADNLPNKEGVYKILTQLKLDLEKAQEQREIAASETADEEEEQPA